jgi:hypothetical protein
MLCTNQVDTHFKNASNSSRFSGLIFKSVIIKILETSALHRALMMDKYKKSLSL